jgi:hypothetical protein
MKVFLGLLMLIGISTASAESCRCRYVLGNDYDNTALWSFDRGDNGGPLGAEARCQSRCHDYVADSGMKDQICNEIKQNKGPFLEQTVSGFLKHPMFKNGYKGTVNLVSRSGARGDRTIGNLKCGDITGSIEKTCPANHWPDNNNPRCIRNITDMSEVAAVVQSSGNMDQFINNFKKEFIVWERVVYKITNTAPTSSTKIEYSW